LIEAHLNNVVLGECFGYMRGLFFWWEKSKPLAIMKASTRDIAVTEFSNYFFSKLNLYDDIGSSALKKYNIPIINFDASTRF
jgi:hypothetical protein